MGLGGVMMQCFHWYTRPEEDLWRRVKEDAASLAKAGFTALWLPPPYKGQGVNDVGYAPYDLYDLGEFDQKGTVRTKYGTKAEYLAAIRSARKQGLRVYADIVLNHKSGADGWEEVEATKFAAQDRSEALSREEIEAPTLFNFAGRGGKYSRMTWNWTHFDAVDFDRRHPQDKGKFVYLFHGKSFDPDVDRTYANYDYLMGADLDLENPEVRQEMKRWGRWFMEQTHVDGFRFDAVKHVQAEFLVEWLNHVSRSAEGRELFACGEYWDTSLDRLEAFLDRTGGRISLFDVPLHFRFHEASRAGGAFDMRKLLDGSLVARRPQQAVTFVDNHDTQPLQALESLVEPWFKPLAYATILLREGGYPCVFCLDYHGGTYVEKNRRIEMPGMRGLIDRLLAVRRDFAHGRQIDYFDHEDVIGWTRLGDEEHPKALAVVMTDAGEGGKWMNVERPNAEFADALGNRPETVRANADGFGQFFANGGSVSAWVQK